ncbi:MAG: hypothetical protein KDL87_12010, partial [Verrucomicrobiae bacterium]|nr:hypothetical protein [Verrucomicrobiae bacterium]
SGNARWPESGCFVVPLWFMQQPGLIQGLSEAPWDLFVVDGLEEEDSQIFTKELDLLSQVIPLKPGGSLVVAIRTDQLAGREVHLAKWERFNLARYFAKGTLFREIRYERSAPEREVGSLIEKLASHPAMGAPRDLQKGRKIPARQLEWAWSRGVIPTTSFLRMLKIPPAIRGDNRPEEAFELPEDCLELIHEILWRLDDLGDDPKLAALLHQLQGLRERPRETGHIVILTSYLATLDYLACALEDVVPGIFRLSGELSADDRKRVLHAFEEKGGCLICTHAFLDAIQTLGIEGIDLAIVYEEPASTNASWASLMNPALSGPSSPPEIWVLRPSDDSSLHGVVEASLRRWMDVEKTISPPDS